MSSNTSPTTKAVQAIIYLGTIPIDVYQMPNGDYELYHESVIDAVDRPRNDLLRFLNGKSLQALPYKGKNWLQKPMIEVEGHGGFIKPIPIEVATAYWFYRAIKGNLKAQALAQACMAESIERRADIAFRFKRTEMEYNKRFGRRYAEILEEQREEIRFRRLPGDDLYLPPGIN